AVAGDADELAQLFQNLMDNAIKYGRRGTMIEIGLGLADRPPPAMGHAPARGAVVDVSVRDQGEGIAREHLPRLTERFYRVDPARSRDLGGTGLGLAIVKHIVGRHRGALTIESTLGEGSTFTVHLPAAPA
ncbi:MAG: sensor histidine kinase, partial [Alphaproteobacteria bacterium]